MSDNITMCKEWGLWTGALNASSVVVKNRKIRVTEGCVVGLVNYPAVRALAGCGGVASQIAQVSVQD